MSPRKAVAVIAGVLLALGLVLAVTSLSTGLGSSKLSCGSALDPSYIAADIQDIVEPQLFGSYVADCRDVVSGRRLIAFPLAGAAALALAFIWLTGEHKTRWDAESAPADETTA